MTIFNPPSQARDTIPLFDRSLGSWQVSVRRVAYETAELSDHYDRLAPRWCRMIARLGFPGAYEGVFCGPLRRDLEAIALGADRPPRVLDCGIGTGAFSRALARAWKHPFRLDGIDLSPRMLQQAETALDESDGHVSLRRGDVCKLPYSDNTFDLVITAHVLEHLPNPNIALREMIRVLRPGGRLITCVTRRDAFGILVQILWRTHGLTKRQAETWFDENGLVATRSVPLDTNPICRRLSVVCVGRKPQHV